MEHATHHHKMPTRRGAGMSVNHLRKKLGGHPSDALINGLFQVQNGRPWMIKASSDHRVGHIRDYLKRHAGEQMAMLDLHVTVFLKRRHKKAKGGAS